jgi:hypothetical protein
MELYLRYTSSWCTAFKKLVGGQLYSAFVVLLNVKHSLCILTDCVALSHFSAMRSYHFDPHCVTEIWCLSYILRVCVFIVSLYYITEPLKQLWVCFVFVSFCVENQVQRQAGLSFFMAFLSCSRHASNQPTPLLPYYFHLLFTDHFIIQYCKLLLLLTALLFWR